MLASGRYSTMTERLVGEDALGSLVKAPTAKAFPTVRSMNLSDPLADLVGERATPAQLFSKSLEARINELAAKNYKERLSFADAGALRRPGAAAATAVAAGTVIGAPVVATFAVGAAAAYGIHKLTSGHIRDHKQSAERAAVAQAVDVDCDAFELYLRTEMTNCAPQERAAYADAARALVDEAKQCSDPTMRMRMTSALRDFIVTMGSNAA